MLIFLIGMPGSGKSTLSKSLSAKLHLHNVDLDAEIVKKEKKTIEEIFKEHGEAYFRELERDAVRQACLLDNAIVSTGGGAPCFFDNMRDMKAAGVTIFLNVPIEVLASRMKAQDPNRPMLKDKSAEELKAFLNQKIQDRAPYYKSSAITIDGADIGEEDIISALKKAGYL